MNGGILNHSQFWITDASISVKRYRLYGQSVLDRLIGIITVAYTLFKLVEVLPTRSIKRTSTWTNIPNKTLVWQVFAEVRISRDSYGLDQLLFGVLASSLRSESVDRSCNVS